MRDFCQQVVDFLKLKSLDYGDVRLIWRRSQELSVKNDIPEVVRQQESLGWGVRVLINGGWGFAASSEMKTETIGPTVEQAMKIANASGKVLKVKEPFSPAKPVSDKYRTPFRIDPFSIGLDVKMSLLLQATGLMLREKGVKLAQGFLDSFKEDKVFASTEGALIEQEIVECGGGIVAYAISKGEMQHRSYPSSFRGNYATSGWEFVESLNLVENAPRVASEAVALLKAPPCPEMTTTLILEDDQLALQVHESIGHAIELDRILGSEVSLAGTSFLNPSMLNQLKYGSKLVNVTADATSPRGLGTFGYDDEGVQAQRAPIIRDGILVGFLTSCATAPVINQASNGTMRADGWSNIPLIRMTNINLEPGEWERDNLLADTKEGLWLKTNKSWSIDDKRLNFQFSTEMAVEIKRGKLGKIYKNPVYTGITPEFWSSCDAICNKSYWRLWGTPNCGKGEPMQSAHVGHGVAPARFRNIKVWGTE